MNECAVEFYFANKLNELYLLCKEYVLRFLRYNKINNNVFVSCKVRLKANVKNMIELLRIAVSLTRSSECKCLKKCLLTQVITKKHELSY